MDCRDKPGNDDGIERLSGGAETKIPAFAGMTPWELRLRGGNRLSATARERLKE